MTANIKRSALLAALAAALSAPAAVPLAAQTIPSPYQYVETAQSAGVWAGYLRTDPGRWNTGLQPGPIFGSRYTIRLTGPLSFAAGAGLMPTTRVVHERVVVRPDSVILDPVEEVDVLLGLVEAGLRFTVTGTRTWNGLAPYLGLSLGATANLRGRPAIEEELETTQRVSTGPAFALGLSAGTDWFLNERLSLRAEARNYTWRLVTPEGLTPGLVRDSQWTNNLGITLGASLHF